jgi:hypothetical protein
MEIIGNELIAWTRDGQPFGACTPEDPSKTKAPARERLTSQFKSGFHLGGPPVLADLDGDGVAEIVCFDQTNRQLRAWHGNGKGICNPDGVIAQLPDGTVAYSVSVADLGGDGEMDFFVGTSWVKLGRDGKSTITPMLPQPAPSRTHPTICDIDGDGKAEVLLGLMDGRVIVYETGKEYRPEWIQWGMVGCNPRHTGCWMLPRKK